MTVDIRVTPQTRRVLINLARSDRRIQQAIKEQLHQAGQRSVNAVRDLISGGSKSGARYSSLPNRSSAPREAPANQSGTLLRSSSYTVRGWEEMEFGESVEYAKFLEEGTRRMAPRQHMITAVNQTASQTRDEIERAINEVVVR